MGWRASHGVSGGAIYCSRLSFCSS
ncbi:MAG: hypothetical protein EON58_13910 [Alphaproteobacteria bacterium]|nr:MAG: hypothetical protein EON58_13910 [Alphaproteobacteria bacterium]